MNATAIFCCYFLLPYFASIVSPPREATTCTAAKGKDDKPKPCELMPEWFEQKLDHFHRSDKRKWRQRYYVNATHYEGIGPVFLLVGGKDEITPKQIQEGRWNDYAQRARALLIALEHRFIGDSFPTGSKFQGNYIYMSTEQVLADAARFIYNFPRLNTYTVPETAKWIAIGVSEGGSLATWLRMKYPHLVHGELSLSAPLLAKVKFNEFYESIERDMLNKEKDFKAQLVEAYTDINKRVAGYGVVKLGLLGFKLTQCVHSLLNFGDKLKNVQQMYFIFANLLSKVLQHGDDTFISEKKTIFDIMANKSSTYPKAIDRFALAIYKLIKRYDETCFPGNYEKAMESYKGILNYKGDAVPEFPYQSFLGRRHFMYQRCTEFGQFQISENAGHFFGDKIPLQFYVDICTALFGKEFNLEFLNKAVLRTNLIYGGLNNKVSNAIFVYGDLDPWKKLGITSPKMEDNNVAFIIQGAKHCDNLDNVGEIEEVIYKKIVDLLKLH